MDLLHMYVHELITVLNKNTIDIGEKDKSNS
jgi:hypothetical protein